MDLVEFAVRVGGATVAVPPRVVGVPRGELEGVESEEEVAVGGAGDGELRGLAVTPRLYDPPAREALPLKVAVR